MRALSPPLYFSCAFCIGNALKYMWRSGLKGDTAARHVEDLKTARWNLDREIARLERAGSPSAG